MTNARSFTARGAATRDRIVASAADLVLARGVGGTTLDDVCGGTKVSRSQLFHYFPEGKAELVEAIAAYQTKRVFDVQRPHIDRLDSWEEWEAWKAALLRHYGGQGEFGCPIGNLTAELASVDPERGRVVAEHLEHWRQLLERGVERTRAAGLIDADADSRALSMMVLAALQGGLVMTQAMQSLEPLEASLDGALTALRAHRPD